MDPGASFCNGSAAPPAVGSQPRGAPAARALPGLLLAGYGTDELMDRSPWKGNGMQWWESKAAAKAGACAWDAARSAAAKAPLPLSQTPPELGTLV